MQIFPNVADNSHQYEILFLQPALTYNKEEAVAASSTFCIRSMPYEEYPPARVSC